MPSIIYAIHLLQLQASSSQWPPAWCGTSAEVAAPNGRQAVVTLVDTCGGCGGG